MDESTWEQDTPKWLWPWMSPCQSRSFQSTCGRGYVCATAAAPVKGLWPKDASTLEKGPLEASVAVHEVMLDHFHLEQVQP